MNPLSPCQTTSLVLFMSGLTTQRTISWMPPSCRMSEVGLCVHALLMAHCITREILDRRVRATMERSNGRYAFFIMKCIIVCCVMNVVLLMLLLLFLIKADNCQLDKIKARARVVYLFRNRGTIKVNWILLQHHIQHPALIFSWKPQ